MGGGPKTVEKIKITQNGHFHWKLHKKLGSKTYGHFFDLRYSIGATADRRLLITHIKGHHKPNKGPVILGGDCGCLTRFEL